MAYDKHQNRMRESLTPLPDKDFKAVVKWGAKNKAIDERVTKSIHRNDKKRLHEFSSGKGGTSYASHAAKDAMAKSDKKYATYEKERKARYKREGISE